MNNIVIYKDENKLKISLMFIKCATPILIQYGQIFQFIISYNFALQVDGCAQCRKECIQMMISSSKLSLVFSCLRTNI